MGNTFVVDILVISVSFVHAALFVVCPAYPLNDTNSVNGAIGVIVGDKLKASGANVNASVGN